MWKLSKVLTLVVSPLAAFKPVTSNTKLNKYKKFSHLIYNLDWQIKKMFQFLIRKIYLQL